MKKNTAQAFFTIGVSGIANLDSDKGVCVCVSFKAPGQIGEFCLPIKTCHDGLEFRDCFWPLYIYSPVFAQCLTHLPEDVTVLAPMPSRLATS